jgi:hypothetical protein
MRSNFLKNIGVEPPTVALLLTRQDFVDRVAVPAYLERKKKLGKRQACSMQQSRWERWGNGQRDAGQSSGYPRSGRLQRFAVHQATINAVGEPNILHAIRADGGQIPCSPHVGDLRTVARFSAAAERCVNRVKSLKNCSGNRTVEPFLRSSPALASNLKSPGMPCKEFTESDIRTPLRACEVSIPL